MRKQSQDKRTTGSGEKKFFPKNTERSNRHTEKHSSDRDSRYEDRSAGYHKKHHDRFSAESPRSNSRDYSPRSNSKDYSARSSRTQTEHKSFGEKPYSERRHYKDHPARQYSKNRSDDFKKDKTTAEVENEAIDILETADLPTEDSQPHNPSDNCIYGIHAVEELLKNRLTAIDHIYFSKEKKNPELFNLIKICRKERLAYNLVPENRIEQISHTLRHQGVAAICSVKEYCSTDTLKSLSTEKQDCLFLIPASVEDPGNLGAIVRSSVAFNVDAMILERKNTSPLNASVAKSAAGMLEHMEIARPKNIEALIEEFKEKGFAVIGADAEKGLPPDQVDMCGPVVLVLGGEHRAIPPYLDKACTAFVSIPMSSKAQSLNVSAATAVLLYECNRQRLMNKQKENV